MKTTVYALVDPVSRETRYVGKTVGSLRRRLQMHLGRSSRGGRTHRDSWIRSLTIAPKIVRLCSVFGSGADGADVERSVIATMRLLGHRLVNATAGGEGAVGRTSSPETIAKRVAATQWYYDAMRGRPLPPATRARISAALKDRPRSPEHCKAISEAKRGTVITPEHRAKLSASMLAYRAKERAAAEASLG